MKFSLPVVAPSKKGTPVDLKKLVGVTAFALGLRNEVYIRSFIERIIRFNYNTIRLGSETGGWTAHDHPEWLPEGPKINTKAARKNVKKVLRIAAEYPNLWVQLVVGFTARDDHRATKRWAKSMARISRPYRNVFLSAMNEPYMSNWTTGELIELIDICKRSKRPVGVDQQAEGGHWRYNRELAAHCDYLDMHPRRNPDLNRNEIENLERLNNWVFLSETTCYLSDANATQWPSLRNNSLFYLDGNSKEKAQRREARNYKNRVKRVHQIMWSFHSIDLIKCNTLDFWLPRWR
ncbi:MAG: hypothetical protein GY896_22855 [Gammaproteobacteria bacterium]|nr:hypothetical protein [Gammaproteobacteria bacterium]